MAGSEGTPADRDEFRSTHAIRDALPTRRHAEMLFDMVVDLLGEEAWVETWNGETTRTLFRREGPGSRWILPWPLVSVTRGGREGPSPVRTGVPGVYEEPKPRPGPAPRLRDLGAGSIQVHDGPQSVTVCYGADGRWFEMTRGGPRETLAGVLPALEAKNAPPVELVASWLAGLDIARHGPGRVHMPVALPGGAHGTWLCGLHAIREALFNERVPRSARWVAADGWTGRAVAWGPTREAAMESWRAEVARVRPFPESPKEPIEPPPEPRIEQSFEDGKFAMWGTLRGPSSDVPRVEPTAGNSPAAVLSLESLPSASPPLGEWTWLVGAHGNVVPAALRLEKGGFTLVGDRILERLDLGTLEDRLAQADLGAAPRPVPPPDLPFKPQPTDSHLRTYRLVDESTGSPVEPAVVGQSWSRGFRPIGLDGDHLRWSVLRLRPEDGSAA